MQIGKIVKIMSCLQWRWHYSTSSVKKQKKDKLCMKWKNEHTKIYENMHVIKISVFRTPPIYFLIYDQSSNTLNLVVPTQA